MFVPIAPKLIGMSVSVARATDELAVEVNPAPMNSVNDYATVTGSVIDTLNFLTVAFTIVNTGANSITWKVIASNASDFSAAVEVQAEAALAAGLASSFAAAVAPWRYYKVMHKSTVGGDHGQSTVRGIAKAG